MKRTFNVAIDGPAGSGKSTVAKRLAADLGFCYVDTGAIYRTVAYFLDLLGISPKDVDGVARYIDELTVELAYDSEGAQHVLMNGMDVTADIRTPEISRLASQVSAHKAVRDMLLEMQRAVAREQDCVMDGRDIGTVVLPNAQVKIFLTASPEVRARRRTQELAAKGESVCYERILQDIHRRDEQDTHRAIAPLKQAKDAIRIDTSEMEIEQVIAAVKEKIEEKRK